ncbi:MAG: DUF302 domain-containing protein [Pseudomonadota bacterium]
MRLTRYWMTGCMALVLMAAGRLPDLSDWRDRDEASVQRPGWVTVTSQYSVDETVQKLEQAARFRGLSVVAKVSPGQVTRMGVGPTQAQVLVLGHAGGQTPMVQTSANATPDLPLSLVIARGLDGRTRVSFDDGHQLLQDKDIPPEFIGGMTLLPKVVGAAIV